MKLLQSFKILQNLAADLGPVLALFSSPFECSAGHRDSLIQKFKQLVSIAHYEVWKHIILKSCF